MALCNRNREVSHATGFDWASNAFPSKVKYNDGAEDRRQY